MSSEKDEPGRLEVANRVPGFSDRGASSEHNNRFPRRAPGFRPGVVPRPPPKPAPGPRPPNERWARFVLDALRRMHAELAAGKRKAIARAVYSLAGLHAGAGEGFPSRESIFAECFGAWVAAGEHPLLVQHDLDAFWARGLSSPLWPEWTERAA